MAAAKKVLAANVFVDGKLFMAGETPEKAYADQITNPKAWTDAKAAESDDSASE